MWVKRTEGMSLSHLKEVVISTIVMGREFEEVMDNLEGLKKAPSIKGSGTVGFNRQIMEKGVNYVPLFVMVLGTLVGSLYLGDWLSSLGWGISLLLLGEVYYLRFIK